MATKQEILGQYFTKKEIVSRLLDLVFSYKKLPKTAKILEPSAGTGNFVSELKNLGYKNIMECEIDPALTKHPQDFFNLPLGEKFDLIVGNPPFTKYNLLDSYYRPARYASFPVPYSTYLPSKIGNREKEKIENAFIHKSLKHLKNSDSTIGYILPVSFFIKNKNRLLKSQLVEKFQTIIIYQNDAIWFDRNIPCCFLILTNSKEHAKKIICIYENGHKNVQSFGLEKIHDELIPKVIFNKAKNADHNAGGAPLSNYLELATVRVKKSFTQNNISAKNITQHLTIPARGDIENYKLAVVRVGNSSVGKTGFINPQADILNDMFYVFDFKPKYNSNRKIKEKICQQINENREYFKDISCRVGSKSIKKEDLLNLRVWI